MCPPKIDSAISQQQKLQANNPQAPNPPASIPPSQNPPQMNQSQQLKPKPKTQVEILLQYEHEKGISVKQKRHQIELMQKYEKERPKILKKQIDKQNALARRIKCLNPSCQLTFARLSLMRMHVAQEHKQLADRSGILLYECNLCNLYSTLNERVLQKHQVSCARLQRSLLEARGELEEEEEALNTEEELEFQRAQKFN